ncbi:hypothetical protein TNCV_4629111 [Trichonephila clavipes]|nr:hypothetical protein TNCV_4629111 [Trichonephila clavipes]
MDPRFSKCDEEDAETWMACECGFQMLNDDKIVTSVQEEYSPVNDEMDDKERTTTTKVANGSSILTRFRR